MDGALERKGMARALKKEKKKRKKLEKQLERQLKKKKKQCTCKQSKKRRTIRGAKGR